ncbi:MAG: TolC family protein [Pirellulales bacterium]|nr:TolC family protein [Pirellulales bacterium]
MPNLSLRLGLCLALVGASALSVGCTTPLRLQGDRLQLEESDDTENLDRDPWSSEFDDEPRSDSTDKAVRRTSYIQPTGLQAENGLRIDEVLQTALDNHPLLRARQHEIDVARAKLVTAGLLANPQLVLDTESPVQESDPTDLTTRLMFTIPTGGKLRLGQEVACAGIRRARLALSREAESVLVEAADAAMEVLYLQELVSLRTQLSELAAREAEIQQARFEAMASTYADKADADFDAAGIELARLETAGDLEVARLRLSRAMGQSMPALPRMAGAHVVEPIPDLPLATVLAAARFSRPELAEAEAAVTVSRRELDLARANAKPDLEMGPRYQALLGKSDDSIGARINFDLPVFDRNQGGISESTAQIQADRALADLAELTTLNDVASAYEELRSLWSSLQYYDQHVMPLIRKTESTILQDQQRQGIGANQVSDLLQDFVKLRVEHLNLRYRYNRLLIRLELFLGSRLDELSVASEPLAIETPLAANR